MPLSRERSSLTGFIRLLVAGLGALSLLAMPNPAAAETLKIGGTGAVTEMLRLIGPAFEASWGIRLQVIPSLGSSGANAAVADGVLGIAVSGRGLKDSEAAKGLAVAASYHTPFGLATARSGPDNLKSAEIASLYRADRPTWPDGVPIRIILRPVEESDNTVLGEMFPGMAEAIKHLRTRSDLSVAGTDQDNAVMAEQVSGSLISATLAQLMTERRPLRFVSIDGVAPSLENYENGSYPYGKMLHFVVPGEVTPEASAFLSFLATPAAQTLLRKAGLLAGAK